MRKFLWNRLREYEEERTRETRRAIRIHEEFYELRKEIFNKLKRLKRNWKNRGVEYTCCDCYFNYNCILIIIWVQFHENINVISYIYLMRICKIERYKEYLDCWINFHFANSFLFISMKKFRKNPIEKKRERKNCKI